VLSNFFPPSPWYTAKLAGGWPWREFGGYFDVSAIKYLYHKNQTRLKSDCPGYNDKLIAPELHGRRGKGFMTPAPELQLLLLPSLPDDNQPRLLHGQAALLFKTSEGRQILGTILNVATF